jgi:hypothetical protein
MFLCGLRPVHYRAPPVKKKRAHHPVSPLKFYSETKHHRPTREVRRNDGDDVVC